jgi:hypothetical protein
MPPWINIASLRHALSLGRHRIETASDAISLVDRLRDRRSRTFTPRPCDGPENAGQASPRSNGNGRNRP